MLFNILFSAKIGRIDCYVERLLIHDFPNIWNKYRYVWLFFYFFLHFRQIHPQGKRNKMSAKKIYFAFLLVSMYSVF